MPFVPVPNTIQVNIRYLLLEQLIENVLYFSGSFPFDVPALTAIAANIFDAWGDSVLPLLSINLLLREVVVTSLETATAPTATWNNGGVPRAGGANIGSLPGNNAVVVSLRTPLRGRSYRGRTYIPGLPENGVTGNSVEGALVTNLIAAYNTFATRLLNENGLSQVVVSKFTNNVQRLTGLATVVTARVIVDNFVDSQRRRLSGRGR